LTRERSGYYYIVISVLQGLAIVKTVSLKLPEALDARLAAAARQRRTSKSAVVRDALETLFASRQETGRRTCLELAADLAGCVEGPGDLSVNKKYLDGFGQ